LYQSSCKDHEWQVGQAVWLHLLEHFGQTPKLENVSNTWLHFESQIHKGSPVGFQLHFGQLIFMLSSFNFYFFKNGSLIVFSKLWKKYYFANISFFIIK
jgi:hypothetical protein